MTTETPIQQSPADALRQALEIAETWTSATAHHDPEMSWRRIQYEFEDIARLLRHALDQLGEPNLAAVQAAAMMLREADGSYDNEGHIEPRYARDAAAAILKAAVTGEIPQTWSET